MPDTCLEATRRANGAKFPQVGYLTENHSYDKKGVLFSLEYFFLFKKKTPEARYLIWTWALAGIQSHPWYRGQISTITRRCPVSDMFLSKSTGIWRVHILSMSFQLFFTRTKSPCYGDDYRIELYVQATWYFVGYVSENNCIFRK